MNRIPIYVKYFEKELKEVALVLGTDKVLREHSHSNFMLLMVTSRFEFLNCIAVEEQGAHRIFILQTYDGTVTMAVREYMLCSLLSKHYVYCLNLSLDITGESVYKHEITAKGKALLQVAEYRQNAKKRAAILGIDLIFDTFDVLDDGSVILLDANQVTNGVYYIPDFVTRTGTGCFRAYRGEHLTVINTGTRLKSISSMFQMCRVKVLDLMQFSTTGVENMSFAFADMRVQKILGLSELDTSAVKDMSFTFANTQIREGLNLCSWDTTNVENTVQMFTGTHTPMINIDTWVMPKLQQCDTMFAYADTSEIHCGALNVTRVASLARVFAEVPIKTLDISAWQPTNCDDFSQMFMDCTELQELHIFDIISGTVSITVTDMFSGCASLTKLYLSKDCIIPEGGFEGIDSNAIVWRETE